MEYTTYHKALNNNSAIVTSDQFTDLLIEELPKYQDLIIMRAINIQISNGEDQDAHTLLDTIAAFNLKQHIDLIITSATYDG